MLMLALATGASTAMFSVIDGVLLQSPFTRPAEIASVRVTGTDGRLTAQVPREAYERIASFTPLVAAAADFSGSSPIVTGVDVPRRSQVECVPASMAAVLGSQPVIGRWFSADEDRPGGPGVAVVSGAFWRTMLGGSRDVLGRVISLDGEPVTVIGVMARGFNGPLSRINRDMWVPYGQVTPGAPRYGCSKSAATNVFVRVQEARSLPEAQTALTSAVECGMPGPDCRPGSRVELMSLTEETLGDVRGPLLALTGAVIAVLLIACANVANLGLERLAGRRREIAVRMALGASRGRIVRQTVVEHLLQAAVGAALGVFIAWLALDALVSLLPRFMPHVEAISMNGRVLAASIGLVLAGGLVVGLIPALQASSLSLTDGLAAGTRGGTPPARRLRRALVVAELALGVALLAGALLMVRTFLTLRPSAPGFDPTNKLIALTRLPAALSQRDRLQFAGDVRTGLLAIPGVRDVAGTTYIPMSRSVSSLPMSVGDAGGEVWTASVTPNYFDVMAIPIVRGRGMQESDAPAAVASAVVNEAFVRRWLAGREPIDAIVTVGGKQTPRIDARVVGVIADTRSMGADTRARPELYVPFAQHVLGSPYFVIAGSAEGLTRAPAALRDLVARLRPGQIVDRIESFSGMLAQEVSTPRFGAWLFGLFAAIAVTLSALGLMATLTWSVTERRREIGIRMALGADRGRVRRMVVWQTLRLAAAGIVIGLALAVATTRYLQSWLYGITATDPATFAACAGLMLAVSIAAAYVPVRRASHVDPIVALRAD